MFFVDPFYVHLIWRCGAELFAASKLGMSNYWWVTITGGANGVASTLIKSAELTAIWIA